MNRALSSLFREHFRIGFQEDEWSSKLQGHLSGQKLDKTSIKSLLQASLSSPCSTYKEEIALLKDFAAVLLFTRTYSFALQEMLLQEGKEIFRKTIHDHPLILLLKSLIAEFLPLPSLFTDSKQRKKLLEDSFLDSQQIPVPSIECEIAALSLVLGNLHADEELKTFARQKASTLMLAGSDPFFSLWSRSQEYSFWETLLAYYFLASTAGYALEENAFLKRIESELKGSSLKAPVFFILFEEWRPKEGLSVSQEKVHFDQDKGLCVGRKDSWHAAFTLQGMNTSLGALRSGGVEITAFGPQFFPLSDSSSFGIHRLWKTKTSAKNISFSEHAEGFTLQGWTRLCEKNKPSKAWLKLKADMRKEGCAFALSLLGASAEKKVALSFYVKAKLCLLEGGPSFAPRSLQRYEGKASSVQCRADEGGIEIQGPGEGRVHIIPLAGKGFFWDADFLIAYEISSIGEQSLSVKSLVGLKKSAQ